MTSSTKNSWTRYVPRLEREVTVARWGHYGTPVLVFPTAGGDAEEIERFHLVGSCDELVGAGRIKMYSVDSVNGRAMLTGEGDSGRRAWIQREWFEFIRHELVPAIRDDCAGSDIEMIAAGASIGAFNGLGCVCLHPDLFLAAVCMSGTFELRRFLNGPASSDYAASAPLDVVPNLEGRHLEILRQRFVILASGEGEAEDIGESWNAARVLGAAGVPNRVDSWGPQWKHDWPLWRAMLPGYLGELLDRAEVAG